MRESMFKVGDRITIREDLKEGSIDFHGDTRYSTSGESVVEEMLKYRGKSAIITKMSSSGKYYLDIDNGEWSWTHHMFEEGKEVALDKDAIRFEVGDRITIREDLKCETILFDGDSRYTSDRESVVQDMLKYCGKTAIIKGMRKSGKYILDIDDGYWSWTHHMFKEGDVLDVQQPKEQEPTFTSPSECIVNPTIKSQNETYIFEPIYTKPSRVEELDKLVDTIVERLEYMDLDFEKDIRLDRMIVDMAYAKGIKDMSVDEKEVLISKILIDMKNVKEIVVHMSCDEIILNFV